MDETTVPQDQYPTTDLPADQPDNNKQSLAHHVVGVGASAGGLEALEKLFAEMPVNTGASFVVVQHLSPDFKSHMDNLLSRVTSLPVRVVDDGEAVQPNTIYLIPPKKEMVISNGRLLLTDRSSEKVLTHPIDQFLRSLAQDAGSKAVAVILSGTGSDGSRGVVDVHENGGMTIAQQPATCRFDAMPVNACDTGCVRMILPPEEIGAALQRFLSDGLVSQSIETMEAESLEEGGLNRIFVLLQRAHKIDFSLYKSGTVGRRVQRRIEMTNCENLDQYVHLLNGDHNEVEELYKDLLIGVTKFFRDAEAFGKLETDIIPEMIQKADGNVIRVWVCACATGEEAYSLAILFAEAIERSGKAIEFKIFATDAHRTSLQFAAAGIYCESALNAVSLERREKFFVTRPDGFLVNTDLRRNIVFAPHNVVSDPPFTQMDMVSCRNMLIYLQPPAQRKTLSLFHFALKINGVLFLGPSESTGDIVDEFDSIDAHWKIYRKRRDVRLPVDMRMPLQSTGLIIPQANRGHQDGVPSVPREMMPALYDHLLGQFMPPSIVVDDRFEILHVFPGAEPFLRVIHGRPSTNLLDQVQPSLKSTLAGALRHAQRDQTQVRYNGISHPDLSDDRRVQLIVSPVNLEAARMNCLLVRFEVDRMPLPSSGGQSSDSVDSVAVREVDISDVTQERIDVLERDLDYSRQNLQATIEELETSNEELQATNEEMVAANEELQSTNEELHSVNEELYTVNAEHQRRLAELDEANADMNNLLATTRVGVLFLDNEFYIRRFTPAVGRMFYIENHDIGRSVRSFVDRVGDEQFMDRLTEVLEKRIEREWEISIDGEAYLIRALPYWTDSKILGVVVAFVNVQPLKRAIEQLEQFKYMCDVAYDGQVLTDAKARIIYCNETFSRRLDYSREELLNMSVMQFDAEHGIEAYREKLRMAVEEGGVTFESTHRRKDGSTYPVEISLTHVLIAGETYLYSQVRDITERRRKDDQRRLLESAVASVTNGIVISDARQDDHPITFVNQGFLDMTGYSADEVVGRNCRFLQCDQTGDPSVAKIREGLKIGEPVKSVLLNQRKDGQLFWNDLYITPVRDSLGILTHFVGVQNDITDRIAIEKELREAKDQADLANRTKSRFLANMSHELRTPMAAILGFTEILQQEVSNADVNDRLVAIQRNGEYLLRLLNDVLDLSRIEAGKMSMTQAEFDLPELLISVDELMQIRTREYENTLTLTVDGPIPKTITSDEARLRQVLINLVANALKFAPAGQVTLQVSMKDPSTLQFQIIDDGIGMDSGQQVGLFQPFTQADAKISERFGGTGLGLSISQRLVEAMQGTILVQSELGVGSTFTVVLPVGPVGELIEWKPGATVPANRADTPAQPGAGPTSSKLNARVLIADDMRDVRYIAEHFLKKAGCTVSIAENGRQAVEAIECAIASGNPFELVLMDMQMPVMTGEEAVQELRHRGIDVPVIALTADAMKGTRHRLISAGFNDYMSKPIDAEQLIATAHSLLQ